MNKNYQEYENMDSETLIGIIKDQVQLIKDYEECMESKRRLTRELDIAMHGEDGAAKQASLCDLIHPAAEMRKRIEELEDSNRMLANKGLEKFFFAGAKYVALETERDQYKNLYYQAEAELSKLVESLDKKSIATEVS